MRDINNDFPEMLDLWECGQLELNVLDRDIFSNIAQNRPKIGKNKIKLKKLFFNSDQYYLLPGSLRISRNRQTNFLASCTNIPNYDRNH